jgi:peptidoglycan glycosyltransferase
MAIAWIITSSFYVLASLGSQNKIPARFGWFLGGIVVVSLLMHFAIQRWAPQSSEVLLPIATLLNGIGYVEIARWNPPFASYQSLWFLISAIGLVVTLLVVRRTQDLDRYRHMTLLVAIGLLLLPLVPHIGEDINGARLWVKLGPLSFQPVEFAKILLVFYFASYFASNRKLLTTPTMRVGGRLFVPPRALLPILFAWGLAMAILGAENDIGFALLLFALFMSLLWVSTGLKTYVVLGVGLFAGSLFVLASLFSQVHARVTIWLDPWSVCAKGGSCQIAYGWFSLAAGGATGTGLGLGHSGTVYNITSDMIFAAVGEELGFLGLILVLCLFVAFIGEGFRIAQRAHSDYARLAATGLSAMIGFQAFFIMAGVLRILPFTGLALPFMAYGGSSLFANYVIVAILLRISDENNTERKGGEIVAVNLARK